MKKAAPYFTAILIFLVITFIQFRPAFNGKVIDQYDIRQYQGMSKEIKDFRLVENSEPLWTNSMFSGMPAFQISTMYPSNWMKWIDNLLHLFLPNSSGYMFMYFLGFYFLLLCLRINPWLALIGGLAFGFSSYFYIILEVGHNSKANAIGYLPPILGGIILLMQKKYWLGFLVTTLFLALEFNSNHLQITYYGFLLFILVFLSYFLTAIKKRELRIYFLAVLIFIGSFFISLLPNAGNLLNTYEYAKHSNRGSTELTIDASGNSNKKVNTSGLDKDYALQYSHGVSETFSFLIPNYKGGGSRELINDHNGALQNVDNQFKEVVSQFGAYFGPQDFSGGPSYIGAIVLLLAFFGLQTWRHPVKYALFTGVILSIMLSWGKNFMPLSSFFLDYFPGYNKFRAVSMINIIAELCIPIIAIMSVDQLINSHWLKANEHKGQIQQQKALLISFALTGGFCLLCILLPEFLNNFIKPNEENEIIKSFESSGYSRVEINKFIPLFLDNLKTARKHIFVSDASRSFVFCFLGSLFLFLFIRKKLETKWLILALGILVCTDLWPVLRRYLNEKNFVAKSNFYHIPMNKTDEEILNDKSLNYRVLNLTTNPFADATTSYYHKSIGGYHAAKLKKYDELIQFHLFREINYFNNAIYTSSDLDSFPRKNPFNIPVLNMLNTKYILIPTQSGTTIINNPEINGNAWFIKKLMVVTSADSEIVRLGKINTKYYGLINKNMASGKFLQKEYTAKGTIKLVKYKPNNLIYISKTEGKQFAVFSEIYYSNGWKSFVDGIPVDHFCVNYLLRGMEIPRGQHRIEFRFEPESYKVGEQIALCGSILIVLIILITISVAYKKGEFV